MIGWIIVLLTFSILFIGCAGSGGDSGSYYPLPPSTYSVYQPDVYTDYSQGYQIPAYDAQQQPYNRSKDRWRYIPPEPEQKPQPSAYINTQTGESYMRFGNDENSWYVGPKGDPIMPFGNWKIDQKGNTYMPFGNGYIDSNGTYLMPLD